MVRASSRAYVRRPPAARPVLPLEERPPHRLADAQGVIPVDIGPVVAFQAVAGVRLLPAHLADGVQVVVRLSADRRVLQLTQQPGGHGPHSLGERAGPPHVVPARACSPAWNCRAASSRRASSSARVRRTPSGSPGVLGAGVGTRVGPYSWPGQDGVTPGRVPGFPAGGSRSSMGGWSQRERHGSLLLAGVDGSRRH